MTYKEYVIEYESLLKTFLSYKGIIGSGYSEPLAEYAEKLTDLEEAFPKNAIRYDEEV